MRAIRTWGSVRGVPGNWHPYRDQCGDATRAPTPGPDQAEDGVPILSFRKSKPIKKPNLGRQKRAKSRGFGGRAPKLKTFVLPFRATSPTSSVIRRR